MQENLIVNQNEWRVVGMSRSGNHAIIGWLREQLSGRVCFLNCAEPKNNPFCSARPLGSGSPYVVNYSEFDLSQEKKGTLTPKDYLIYSHEDCFLGLLRDGPWEESHEAWIGPSRSRRDILILRDPFNLFASRMKLGNSRISYRTAARIWKQHAREFLGRSGRLTKQPLKISYNRWVTDSAYRKQITEELGLKPCGKKFERVPQTAGGSSFDGVEFRQKASKMRVFERWREFRDDPLYLQIFDGEMIELAEEIFGPSPAADAIAP